MNLKHKISGIVFAGTLALATTALANPAQQQFIYCNNIADFVQIVAEDRDNGYSVEQIARAVAEQGQGKQDDETLLMLLNEIPVVFQEPHFPPAQEGRLAFYTCYDQFASASHTL